MIRDEKISELWDLTVNALLTEMKADEPRPQMTMAALRFLEHNKIDTLSEGERGKIEALGNLPFKTGT